MTGSDRANDDDPPPEDDGTVRAEFDWSARVPSMAVIETVAIAANAVPAGIDPLYGSVDPDALDALVRSRGMDETNGPVTVAFSLADHDVEVRSDGIVTVRPITERP